MTVLTYFRSKANRISARTDAAYERALRFLGIPDSAEARITATVAVCVALFYTLAGIQYVINLFTDHVAPTLTALLT